MLYKKPQSSIDKNAIIHILTSQREFRQKTLFDKNKID